MNPLLGDTDSHGLKTFYDDLAEHFHLLFQDWNRSIAFQAGVLGPILEKELPETRSLPILDCACGIGTQALGLAGRGHVVTGTDIAASAVARAAGGGGAWPGHPFRGRRYAGFVGNRGWPIRRGAGRRQRPSHLLTDADLTQALCGIAGKLRPGGIFLATIRDYDDLVKTHPTLMPPAFFQDGQYRRFYHQVWDWSSNRQYTLHLYLTRKTPLGWDCRHFVSTYRALLREELDSCLHSAGFAGIRWLMPGESGYYQPLVLARR